MYAGWQAAWQGSPLAQSLPRSGCLQGPHPLEAAVIPPNHSGCSTMYNVHQQSGDVYAPLGGFWRA